MLEILFQPLDGQCDDESTVLAASKLAGKAKQGLANAEE